MVNQICIAGLVQALSEGVRRRFKSCPAYKKERRMPRTSKPGLLI